MNDHEREALAIERQIHPTTVLLELVPPVSVTERELRIMRKNIATHRELTL